METNGADPQVQNAGSPGADLTAMLMTGAEFEAANDRGKYLCRSGFDR